MGTVFHQPSYKDDQPRHPRALQVGRVFKVFYQNLDDDHKGLFDGVFACIANNDQESLEALKTRMTTQFEHEEAEFTKAAADHPHTADHKPQHGAFLAKVGPTTAPLDNDTIHYFKDWLVNHIKTTDFHKEKLNL